MAELQDELIVDFWNVGQGDASSLLIESPERNGRHVLDVIDVGLCSGQFVSWLYDAVREHPVVFRNLILTHNDADHVNGLTSIMKHPSITIQNIHLIEDRQWGKIKRDSPIGLLYRKYKGQINRIEFRSDTPEKNIISTIGNYSLEVAFPGMGDNIDARSRKKPSPNNTSAIIQLLWNEPGARQKHQLVIWGGDNRLATICSHVRPRPQMLFGPHHGGPQDKTTEAIQSITSSISPSSCFLSFATTNGHGHPKTAYVKSLLETGCTVICSQCARSCAKGRREPIFNGDGYYGLKSPAESLACHGHVRLMISNNSVADQLAEPYLEAKQKAGKTLCTRDMQG